MRITNESTPKNWREYRRLRVWDMHRQGYKQQEIADALGLTQPDIGGELSIPIYAHDRNTVDIVYLRY
jgi:DNA-binding transcriptional regulator LsrR (DeoR family)